MTVFEAYGPACLTGHPASGRVPPLRATFAGPLVMVYTFDRYHMGRGHERERDREDLQAGRSQAVRLPLAFRLPGDRVRVRRVEGGILLEPIVTDLDAWFSELDRFADVPFMEDGRRQPPMPESEDLFG